MMTPIVSFDAATAKSDDSIKPPNVTQNKCDVLLSDLVRYENDWQNIVFNDEFVDTIINFNTTGNVSELFY